jgi:hypothetical protein
MVVLTVRLALVATDLAEGSKRLSGCLGEMSRPTRHPLKLSPGNVGTNAGEDVDERRRRCVLSKRFADQWHRTVPGFGEEHPRDRLLVLAAVVDGANKLPAG